MSETLVYRLTKGSSLTWAEGDNNLYNVSHITADETGAVERTTWSKMKDIVSVADFGTLNNDGTTDDAAVFQLAAASGASTILAQGLDCFIGSQIDIPAGQTWVLSGTTLRFSSSTQKVFSAVTVDDWSLIGPFSIVGNGSTVGTAVGVYVDGCNRWRVDDYTAQTIKGHGMKVVPGTPSGSTRGDQGQISRFVAKGCYYGFECTAGTGAEYCTLIAPNITGCFDGLIIAAGNTVVLGGSIVDNTNDGVVLNSGSNHGHGMIVGTNINHNIRYNVYSNQCIYGFSFIGCHIYANDSSGTGAINLYQSKGIVFTGGQVDAWIYNGSGGSSGPNYFRGVYFPGTYGEASLSGSVTELVMTECYGPGAYNSSATISTPGPVYVRAVRSPTSTQSLTNGVATQLVWNTEISDRCGAYNNTTGAFTVPANQAGMYRIRGQALCSGTAITATASYLDVKVGGVSTFVAYPIPYSTDKVDLKFDCEISLAAGAVVTVEALITSALPLFGDTTWYSWLVIERVD